MTTVQRTISAEARIESLKDSGLKELSDDVNRFPWLLQEGIFRANTFLDRCEKGAVNSWHEERHPYLRYYCCYGFIDKHYKLTEKAERFASLSDSENKARFLLDTLNGFPLGCGAWIKSCDDSSRYEFEAKTKSEAAYEYALFLQDIGLIEKEALWTHEREKNIYLCHFTELGRILCRLVAEDHQKRRAFSIFMDKSVKTGNVNGGSSVQGASSEKILNH